MKKKIIFLLSAFMLILTFLFAEMFSIYHFGSVPTILTALYLISIFAIFEYFAISITYVIKNLITKKKIEMKKIIIMILLFIVLLLILLFLITVNVDWLNWYSYSGPFYINVIIKGIEFLLPSIIFSIVIILLLKKKK